jgi:hypothetical protein
VQAFRDEEECPHLHEYHLSIEERHSRRRPPDSWPAPPSDAIS